MNNASPQSSQPNTSATPVCCYCDNDLSCGHCGMEQPYDDISILTARVAELEAALNAISVPADVSKMKARIEELEHPFRAVDERDWRHLLSCIPDSGHGKFWKEVFAEVRAALQPQVRHD